MHNREDLVKGATAEEPLDKAEDRAVPEVKESDVAATPTVAEPSPFASPPVETPPEPAPKPAPALVPEPTPEVIPEPAEDDSAWSDENRQYLVACVRQLQGVLQRSPSARQADEAIVADARARMSRTPALEQTVAAFGLSPFERDVLLLAAAPELDPEFADIVGKTLGDRKRTRPTLGLALAYLTDPHWSAFTPGAPLRRWGLVDLQAGPILTQRPLVCPERTLHHLLGAKVVEPELAARVRTVPQPSSVSASRKPAVEACVAAWAQTPSPVLLVVGREVSTLEQTVSAAARSRGGRVLRLRIDDLPATAEARARFLTVLGLEMALEQAVLLIDAFDARPEDLAVLRALAEDATAPIAVIARNAIGLGRAPVVRVEVEPATPDEQRVAWQQALAGATDAVVDRFVATFDLDPNAIAELGIGDAPLDEATAWQEARAHGRPRMLTFTHPISTGATFDDIVLPELQTTMLHDIVAQVRHRATVYERWGFAKRSGRGMGIAALFAGPSGTGKTLAAEVISHALELDLYRIDLAALTGAPGEAERNLRGVFDAAAASGAVLLIDEADALFGKRAEIQQGADRYANLEVGHLLQQLEAYRGLAILTTNHKGSLDPSLLRRLRFVIDFPMPDPELRERLWQRVFPATVPVAEDLDMARLATLNLTGGNIQNIALGAAFAAADAGEPLGMVHVQRAARAEYAKLGRNPSEVRITS
ncbi:MAG: ATP-binding protein [Myxococcota bacterium]